MCFLVRNRNAYFVVVVHVIIDVIIIVSVHIIILDDCHLTCNNISDFVKCISFYGKL